MSGPKRIIIEAHKGYVYCPRCAAKGRKNVLTEMADRESSANKIIQQCHRCKTKYVLTITRQGQPCKPVRQEIERDDA